MQTRTRPSDEIDGVGDGGVVETEVETVRTRQHLVGAAVDAQPASDAVVGERSVGYFETLPERLSAVGLVVRATIEALLGIRFLLHASGANTSSTFASFVDHVSWPLAGPFANVFSDRGWGPGNFEVSTLVAMLIYLLVFKLVGMMVSALAPRLSGVEAPRGVTAFRSLMPLAATTSPAADDERRRHPRPVPAMGGTRTRRRLLRRARAREA